MRRPLNVDIPELLQRLQIHAQRRGRDWWAPCPLPSHGHTEKRPSWRIHDEPGAEKHGLHVCYGCGGGGGPVGLVVAMLGLEGHDARKQARDWLGTDDAVDLLPQLEIAVGKSSLRRFVMPDGVRFLPLDEWPDTPRAYVQRRGITAGQIDRWGIGYAVDGALGGRIVIPVRASSGRLAAYVGRAFLGSLRRYEEPTEADGADLGVMFGEEHWPAPGPARKHLWLAEGVPDALAIERAAGGFIGALRGSQFGDFDALGDKDGQGALHGLRRLATMTTFEAITVVTDPDAAGDKAARVVRESAGRWCRVRRVILPPRVDAAELAVTAPAELLRRLRAPVEIGLAA